MSTLSEIGDLLEGAGHGVQAPTANADIFLGSSPDAPDSTIVIHQYPGGPPEYVQDSFDPINEHVQIQVVVRAPLYNDAEARAYRIWATLARVTNAVLSGTKYRSIRPNASPALLKIDSNDRFCIYFNASVEKEPSLVLG